MNDKRQDQRQLFNVLYAALIKPSFYSFSLSCSPSLSLSLRFISFFNSSHPHTRSQSHTSVIARCRQAYASMNRSHYIQYVHCVCLCLQACMQLRIVNITWYNSKWSISIKYRNEISKHRFAEYILHKLNEAKNQHKYTNSMQERKLSCDEVKVR